MARRLTKKIILGDVSIGGGSEIRVQSMTNVDTRDREATLNQINGLAEQGCEIIRVAVPDQEAAGNLDWIKERIAIPLIADIHFDHRLALAALERGVDGLRINPGNIGGPDEVEKIARSALNRSVPIRVGVNSGSLEKDLLEKHGKPTPEAMVESALRKTAMLEAHDFDLIKISLKSSNVLDTVKAYRLMSEASDYPLHLGVTEAGTLIAGTVKSSLGIGLLLAEGIGDTFRVSLTRDPVEEIRVAYEILRALDIRHRGPEIISCPTCGRTEIDLFSLVEKVEAALSGIETPIKAAVMGCVVNGPGEAREADVGIAGGRGQGILFRRGEVIRKIPEADLADALVAEVLDLVKKKGI